LFVENWKYLLIDRNNGGVLCTLPNRTVGTNLMLGLLDSRTIEIPLHRKIFEIYKDVDFDNSFLHVSVKREVNPLKPENITDLFLKRREEAKLRAKYLELLEMLSFLSLKKACLGYPSSISSILEKELQSCRPEENYFSEGIKSYAHINQISFDAAYYEIKFKVEGSNTVKIRDYAIFQKYVRIFNTCSLDQLDQEFNNVRTEMFLNAKV